MVDAALSVVLGVHILAGLVALVAGFVGIVASKGGRRHLTAGKSYAIAMGVVVVTAVPLAVAIESWFLLAIAIFSGYLVFAGVRVISRRRSGVETPELVDVIAHRGMIFCGSAMVVAGVWSLTVGTGGLAPVLVVFGGVGIGLAVRELHTLGEPPSDQKSWLDRHISYMGGAYIATVTAATA